jgi:hypothetical protein
MEGDRPYLVMNPKPKSALKKLAPCLIGLVALIVAFSTMFSIAARFAADDAFEIRDVNVGDHFESSCSR